ncbi:helix-turn-helix transcriptional regulator [Streptomyces sp. NPDC001787]|uniref:helix-turn-helix domain-containing protein n=1 Tax=Streptomyces sp. NPDC001787 TaxID=3154523 RepID=UPI00331C2871
MPPAVPSSPRTARKHFGADMRRRREERAISADDLAVEIGCSGSKISRIETGERSANPDDFSRLMDFFDVPEEDQARLEELFRAGRRRTREWWHSYGDVLSKNYSEHISLEHESDEVFECQQAFIPAMCQTEAYAWAVSSVGYAALGPDQIESLVEIKVKRQRRIESDDPLRLHAVITEAALHFQCGGPVAYLEQLRHLREVMARPHIDLRVIPFSKGESGIVTGAFTTFRSDGQEGPTAAFAESVAGTVYIDDALGLRRLDRLSTNLSATALSVEESIALIAKIERELTSP